MARYFKYHSLDDIRAASAEMRLSLSFAEDFSPLFAPVRVGPVTVGNRFCVQPMEGCDGETRGVPGELTFRRYERFGAGGAKLVWAEAAAVLDEGRANTRQLIISKDTLAPLAEMADRCRKAHRDAFGRDDDLLIGLQLTHSGRYSYRKPLIACRDPLLDHRVKLDASYPVLSDDYLDRLIDRYVDAAKLAHRAGYAFVDVKQCHRYLLNELLAATTREGKYGGSYENRTRFARTVFGRIRAEVPGLILATRMNAYDGLPYRADGVPDAYTTPVTTAWGTDANDPFRDDLREPLRWIGEMKSLGVALVNLSLGNPYASPHLLRPFEVPPPDGYETPEHPLIGVDRHIRLTAAVQEAYPDLAVVGSGYSYLQEFLPHAAAANVAAGKVTFAGVGRGVLSQPDFARQLLEHGKLDRKRICRTFSYCTALMRSKHNEEGQFATGCPPFDKEVYGPLWQLAQRKPT